MMLRKIEGRRKRRMKWSRGITDSTDMRLSKLGDVVKDREARRLQSMELQSWT